MTILTRDLQVEAVSSYLFEVNKWCLNNACKDSCSQDRRKTQKSSQIKKKLECESLNTNIQMKALQWRVWAEPACLPEALFRSWVSQSPRLSKSHRSYSDLELSLAEVNQKCCLTLTMCLVGIKAKPKARSCLHLFISSLFLTFLFRKPSWEGRPDIARQVARSLNM